MKFKALPLLTLSLALATLPSFAQTRTKSSKDSGNGFGIDLERSYKGSELLALMQAARQEAESAIDQAFDEGYKAGLLASAPDAEYWKAKAQSAESEIARLKKEKWLFGLGGLGVGVLAGGGLGICFRLQN